ncbi:retention module-containing protein, partial [Marinobacter sp. F3R08]|uniref:retention module-containing protein n=1 Tax=Marinobacter sp. F3R08 TaxID=2841559 RepID=UPI001C082CEF
MSVTVAIVLNTTGKAWAEAPDGSRRLLETGDALRAGDILITEDNARVLLDFGYSNTATIDGGIRILASAEMAPDFNPAVDDTSVAQDSVAEALASIEAALGSSLDDIDAPAAGLDGGSAGGSSSVRLARIVEGTSPADQSIAYNSVESNRQSDVNGDGTETDALPPGTIVIDSLSQGSGVAPNFTATGSVTNLARGSSVEITLTDQDGNTLVQTVTPGSGGQFTAVFSDFTDIVDGPVSVQATATGADGVPVSDSADSTLDITTGALDVTIDGIDNAANTAELSGTTTDVAPGETVNISITDANGNVVNTTAIVGTDGSYDVPDVDLSGLVDGTITVDASGTDRNGNPVSDSETATLDALPGDLTLSIDNIDSTDGTIDLSGTTTDVVPGATVTITITDADGTVVNTSAIVASDGSYSVPGVDVSSLVDGTVTVNASATDRNDNPVSDSGTGTLDVTAGTLSLSVDSVDDTSDTVDLSGTTEDVAPGNSVTITITDADGTVVNTSAIVTSDGSYAVSGVDVSTLVDGTFTVNASATDRNGNTVSDSGTGTLTAPVGDLTLSIDNVDSSNGTIDLSGTTTEVTPGDLVTITITDADGSVVNVSTMVASDGSYSVSDVNVSSLVDGRLTVTASATDRNDNPLSDSGVGVLNATTGTL